MIMAGRSHMPHAYLQTPLVDVLPLELEPSTESNLVPKKVMVQKGSKFEDLLAIGNDMDETTQLWKGLPSLNWVNEKVKSGMMADQLVVSESGYPVMSRADLGAQGAVSRNRLLWKWRNQAIGLTITDYGVRFFEGHHFKTTGKDAMVKPDDRQRNLRP